MKLTGYLREPHGVVIATDGGATRTVTYSGEALTLTL